MLNVGLPGAGRIAGVPTTAISAHPGSEPVTISDLDAEAAAQFAGRHGAGARS